MKVSVSEKNVLITENAVINQGEYCVNECEFMLPNSFDGLQVTAVFNGIPVPVSETRKCLIPSLKKGNAVLGVYAYEKNGEEMKLVYSPKPTMFYVGAGSFSDSFTEEAPPEISRYEEYCNMLLEKTDDAVKSFCKMESFPDFSDKVSRDSTNNEFPDSKAVYDYGQNIKAEIDAEFKQSLEEATKQIKTTVKENYTKDIFTALGESANALKGYSEGSIVRVEDISPVIHNLKVKISSDSVADLSTVTVSRYGKNLIPYPYKEATKTMAGITYTDNGDASVTLSGTSESQTNFFFTPYNFCLTQGVTYTFSVKGDFVFDGSATAYIYSATEGQVAFIPLNSTKNVSFTPEKNYSAAAVYIVIPAGRTVSGTLIPQIEIGEKATSYEGYRGSTAVKADSGGLVEGIESLYPTVSLISDTPGVNISIEYNSDTEKIIQNVKDDSCNSLVGTYSGELVEITDASPLLHNVQLNLTSDTIKDFTGVTVNRCGKNLLCQQSLIKGFLLDAQGNVSQASSYTPYYRVYRKVLPAGKYTISIADSGLCIARIVVGGEYKAINSIAVPKYTFTNTVTGEVMVCFRKGEANSAFNGDEKIQLECGNLATAYEEYNCKGYKALADGTVDGVTSVSPNMVIFADKNGVIVNVQYNKDINKAFEELKTALLT